MQITSNRDEWSKLSGEDQLNFQVLTDVKIGIPVKIKVIFRSANREDTSYEIIDELGDSMGVRRYKYAALGKKVHRELAEDLNILFMEFETAIQPEELEAVVYEATHICESRYGRSVNGGDEIITFR